MEFRSDNIQIQDFAEYDGFGNLKVKAKIARIGVMEYLRDGRVVREMRFPDEVRASASEFSQKPITLNHPTQDVTPQNSSIFLKGLSSNCEYKDGWLIADLTITHQDAIDAALSTHRQLSNGYYTEVFDEAGEWVDTEGWVSPAGTVHPYDSVQKNIVGNHIALVQKARAGNEATFIADSADSHLSEITIRHNDGIDTQDTENTTMDKYTFKDKEYEVSGKDAGAVFDMMKDMGSQIDALTEEISTLKDKYGKATGMYDALEAKIAELKSKETKVDADFIATEVKERVEIWSKISSHVDSEIDYGLSVLDAKKLYLAHKLPHLADKIADAEAGYVNGLWELSQPSDEVEVKVDAKVEQAEQKLVPSANQDADDNSIEALRAKYDQSRKNLFN